MPFGLGQALGAITSGIGQAIANKKQRQWDLNMYEKQKADRLEFWNLENMYNTPEAQMQRFKDAGLNPNLIYGQFNNQTPQIQAPTADSKNVSGNISGLLNQLPQLIPSMINQQYDLRLKDAQTNLLNQKANTEQTVQELNATRVGLTDLLQQSEQLKLALGTKTFNSMVRQAVQAVELKNQEIINKAQDTRLKTQNVALGIQTEKTSKSQEALNKLEKELIEKGFYKTDSALQRLFKEFKHRINTPGLINSLQE